MDIWLKIKNRRNELGLTLKEVAKALGVSESTVQRYETSEIKNMGIDKVEALANILKVTPEYLMGWSDEKGGYSSYGALPVTKRTIPVLGNVHCGTPKYADQEYMDLIDTDVNADFALIAEGDSMIDVGIQDKDLVFVRRKSIVDNGKIAIVLIGEEAAIKRVHKTGDTLILSPANQNYEPLIFDSSSVEDIKILGEVIAYTHYFGKQNSEEE